MKSSAVSTWRAMCCSRGIVKYGAPLRLRTYSEKSYLQGRAGGRAMSGGCMGRARERGDGCAHAQIVLEQLRDEKEVLCVVKVAVQAQDAERVATRLAVHALRVRVNVPQQLDLVERLARARTGGRE